LAWTNPVAATTGQVVTSAFWNTNLTDNLNVVGPHVRIRKSADETVVNSTTLQNDNELLFAIGANEAWVFEMMLYYSGNTAGDLRVAWTIPSGTVGVWTAAGVSQSSNAHEIRGVGILSNLDFDIPLSSNGVLIMGSALAAATAGTIQMQWAQVTSFGTPTTIAAGSTLLAHRVG
jgi:hypothetical protein